MRKTERERFKRIFIEQRNQILANQILLNPDVLPEEKDKDEVDQANADIEQSMRLQLRNRETFLLQKIDYALRKIEDGSFGRCESCDEYIELRRLQARPTTNLCIACKEEEEKLNATSILSHRLQPAY